MRKTVATINEEPGDQNEERSRLIRFRLREGRCPDCGELGRLDSSGGAVCSLHGPYAMVILKENSQGGDPEDFMDPASEKDACCVESNGLVMYFGPVKFYGKMLTLFLRDLPISRFLNNEQIFSFTKKGNY
jgi:hypothetical protein